MQSRGNPQPPAASSCARSGSGGSYLSNESAYRATLLRVVKGLTSSGVVSAASNRRAFRITQEPLDMFRNYFAVYAREQAYCHFSPALISNLEKYWNAASRKP